MSLSDNLRRVLDRVAFAADASGRDPSGITLVAVSKTWPATTVGEVADAGQVHFGENKVQELEEKVPALPTSLRWHLIGHLQKNKVRKVLPLCHLVHTVDSLALAERIDRISGDLEQETRVLLQVNVGGDEAKSGFSPDGVREAIAPILELPRIRVEGLMTVPPYDEEPERVRPHFAALRVLRDELAAASGASLPELSMGMSHDFEVAIDEGATLVRVGSSIFGPRNYGTAGS